MLVPTVRQRSHVNTWRSAGGSAPFRFVQETADLFAVNDSKTLALQRVSGGRAVREEMPFDIRGYPLVEQILSERGEAYRISRSRTVRLEAPEEFQALTNGIFGQPFRPEDYAAIVGAPEGAQVTVHPKYTYEQLVPAGNKRLDARRGQVDPSLAWGLELSVKHPWFEEQTREIYLTDKNGQRVDPRRAVKEDFKPEIYHASWTRASGAPGGMGAHVFAAVVDAAEHYGVRHIWTNAHQTMSMGGDRVGAWVWTRFGYDWELGLLEAWKNFPHPYPYSEARMAQELMALPGGPAYLKRFLLQNSCTLIMKFDLDPNSSSMRAWKNYGQEASIHVPD